MTLNDKIISDLIEVGESFPTDPVELKTRFNDDSIHRLHWKEWNMFCDKLDDDNLILLFKGIVQVENKLKWIGGSVAGGIWIYRNIENRKLDESLQLAKWANENTNNPYLKIA